MVLGVSFAAKTKHTTFGSRGDMTGLWNLASLGSFLFLGTLAIIVVLQLLTGQISLKSLLNGMNRKGNESFSAGRAQLLIVTLAAAMYYLLEVFQSPSQTRMPPVSDLFVKVIGTSQALYLAAKARSMLLKP